MINYLFCNLFRVIGFFFKDYMKFWISFKIVGMEYIKEMGDLCENVFI